MEIKNGLQIKIVLKENKGNLLANAHLTIETVSYGLITIKNFQIWASPNINTRLHDTVNIQPTVARQGFKYYPQVFIEDENKWYLLEGLLYVAYIAEKEKKGNVRLDYDAIDKELHKNSSIE